MKYACGIFRNGFERNPKSLVLIFTINPGQSGTGYFMLYFPEFRINFWKKANIIDHKMM